MSVLVLGPTSPHMNERTEDYLKATVLGGVGSPWKVKQSGSSGACYCSQHPPTEGKTEIAKLLLENKADINLQDEDGRSGGPSPFDRGFSEPSDLPPTCGVGFPQPQPTSGGHRRPK